MSQTLINNPPRNFRAPGRVNLIGEHTDYNGGFVLPIATPQGTAVELGLRPGDRVCVHSVNVPAAERTRGYELGAECHTGTWVDYVAGVTASLCTKSLGIVRIANFSGSAAITVPLVRSRLATTTCIF